MLYPRALFLYIILLVIMALETLSHLEHLENLAGQSLRRQRIFRDRTDSFDVDDREFLKQYRFTKTTTIHIVQQIEHDKELLRHTRRNRAIPCHLQLLLALRFYATGGFQLTIGDTLNMHQTTVCRIVKHVSHRRQKGLLSG